MSLDIQSPQLVALYSSPEHVQHVKWIKNVNMRVLDAFIFADFTIVASFDLLCCNITPSVPYCRNFVDKLKYV